MHFLCTTNFIINYKNQPLLLALGGWLEGKNRSNYIDKLVGAQRTNKWGDAYYFS